MCPEFAGGFPDSSQLVLRVAARNHRLEGDTALAAVSRDRRTFTFKNQD
jgi:hypothetical protein